MPYGASMIQQLFSYLQYKRHYLHICNDFTQEGIWLLKTQGSGGTVVTHSNPTSDIGGSNPDAYVGKLVVS